jgi:hypothetical protein
MKTRAFAGESEESETAVSMISSFQLAISEGRLGRSGLCYLIVTPSLSG